MKTKTIRMILALLLTVISSSVWAADRVVVSSLQNGSITVGNVPSIGDQTVTLTVEPSEGYYVTADDIIVSKTSGAAQSRGNGTPGYAEKLTVSAAQVDATGKGTYTFVLPDGYGAYVEATFTNAIAITPVVSITGWTYGATANIPSVSGNTGNGDVTYSYAVKGTTVFGADVPTDAGDYTVKAVVAAAGHYLGGEATADFTIAKAQLTIATLAETELTYSGAEQTVSVSSVKAGDLDVAAADYEVSGNKGTNVGSYTAKVTAKAESNFIGEVQAQWSIIAAGAATFTVTLSEETFVYDGTAKQPTVTVKDGETVLTAETDYTVAYENNVNAGTGKATVTGKGNYSGTKEATFTITKATLSEMTLDHTTFVYNKTAQTASVTSVKAGELEVAATDYSVSGNTGTNVGTYTVTVTATGNNYQGTLNKDFTISAANASLFDVTLGTTTYTYDGTAKQPTVTVKDGETVLTANTDYTVAYTNNLNAGTATVTVTGKGNYTDAKTANFTINKAQLTIATLAETELTYNGQEQTVSVSSVKAGDLVVAAADYEVSGNKGTNVGSYTAKVTAKAESNFTGEAQAQWSIIAAGAATFTVTLSEETLVYDGTAKQPTVTVKDGETVLTEGTDYTVAYENNVNAGTGKATVTGKGNYSGTKEATFTITKATLTEMTLDPTTFVYNKTAQTASVTSVKAGELEVAATDYSVSGNTGTNVGTYTVTVTATGNNYQGTLNKDFTISAANASLFDVTLGTTTYTYDGTEKQPTVTVKDGETVLTANTDYTVAYTNNQNAGTATVTVTGKGNYTDAKTANFTINKAQLTIATLAETELTYSGAEQTVSVSSVKAGDLVVAAADYEVSGNKGTNVGSYTAKVTAKAESNFTGEAQAQWSIIAAGAATFTVTLSEETLVYDGTAKQPTVTVKDGETVLTANTDYTVAYENNVNAGTGKATVTGKGNYSGTKEATFTITKATLSEMTLDPTTFVYNKTAQTASVTSVKAGELEVAATDYSVSGNTGTNVGTYTVTVTATGNNYQGTLNKDFTISAANASLFDVTLGTTTYTYDGTEKQPTVTVKDGETVLTANTDYTVAYTNNQNAGTATVTVTGKGNYTDAKTANFTIAKAQLTIATLAETELTYSGAEQTVSVSSVKAGDLVVAATDYEVSGNKGTNVGSYTAKVTAKAESNFTGEAQAQWSIIAAGADAKFSIELEYTTVEYDGTEKLPTVTVKDGETVLTANTDYTVAYTNNQNAGTATVTVTGKGNYTDAKTANFTIAKAQLTIATLAETELTYSGAEQTVSVSSVKAGDLDVAAADYEVSGNKGTNVGSYTAKVTAKAESNFTGEAQAQWSIIAAGAATFTVTLSEETFVYDGTAKQPTVTVKDGETVLTAETDYTVAYENNVNAGTGKATVTGKGNYSGTKEATFTITKATLSEMTLDHTTFVYNKTAQTASVTSVKAGELEVAATDYSVSGNTGTNVGTYTVTVTATGNNYQGTLNKDFTISAANASLFDVTLGTTTYTYDGTEKQPTVTVKDGETVLTANTDYTVAYTNNQNAGTATVTVTGKGNYTDAKTANFTINKAQLTIATLAETELTYSGAEQTVSVSSVKAGDLVVAAADYEVSGNKGTNVGSYTAKVTAKAESNFTGEAQAQWSIIAAGAATFTVTLSEETFVYDGTAKQPTVTVKDGETVLTANTDYTVAYENNVNAGTGKATVTGKGNYSGTKEATFTITKATLSEMTLDHTTFVYNKTAQTASVTSVKAGELEVAATDYSVSGNTGTNVGTYTVTVTATGNNYQGTLNKDFTISAANASLFDVTLGTTTYTYDGTEKQPTVTVKDGETVLTANTDYTVAYTNNQNAGTATVTVTGKGNYTDAKTANFTINKAQLTIATLAETELTYSGAEQTVSVSSVKAGDLVVAAADYEVSGNKGTNVGSYTAKVTAKAESNFTGEAQAQWSIIAAGAATFTVTLSEETFVYDGTAKQPTVTVKDGETVLTEGTDYTVSYTNNVEPGTATVTVTGKGNYSGTKEATFTIVKMAFAIEAEDAESGRGVAGVTVSVNVVDETAKTLSIDNLNVPAAAADDELAIYIPATLGEYQVVEINAGAISSDNVTDIYMPDTEQPLTISDGALPGTATIHTTLALLDDYALMTALQQNYKAAKVMTTVTPVNKLWTLGIGCDVILPEALTAYTVSVRNDKEVSMNIISEADLTIDQERVLKGNNGVLLLGEPGVSYDLVAYSGRISSGTAIATTDNKDYGTDNLLEPVVEKMHFNADDSYFVMSNNEFHAIMSEGENVKVPAGKAVLHLTSRQAGSRSITLGVTDGTTGIKDIYNSTTGDAKIYDMQGRKVEKVNRKGLYIINGKKVVVR